MELYEFAKQFDVIVIFAVLYGFGIGRLVYWRFRGIEVRPLATMNWRSDSGRKGSVSRAISPEWPAPVAGFIPHQLVGRKSSR